MIGSGFLVIALMLVGVVWYFLRGASNSVKAASLGAGVLLSVAGGLALLAFTANSPDLPGSSPTGDQTFPGSPVATPSIATPETAR